MLRSIVSHLTGALLVIPLCLCQNAPRECSVTFRLIDRYGTPVPFKVSEFKDTGEQVEYAERFEGDTGRVPCGFYAYALTRLDDAAFPKLRGRLEALRPEDRKSVV